MRLVCGCFLLTGLLHAQTDVRELLEKKTLDRIEQIGAAFDGALGFAAIDLTTGAVLSITRTRCSRPPARSRFP